MSTTIFSCKQGDLVDGFLGTPEIPLHICSVFVQNPWDRLGVSYGSIDYYVEETEDGLMIKHYEISYFIQCLREGFIDPWNILFTKESEDDILSNLFDFDIVWEHREILMGVDLVNNLLKDSLELSSLVPETLEGTVDEYVLESYHRSLYMSLKRVFQARNILTDNTMRVSKGQDTFLDSLNLGNIYFDTVFEKLGEERKDIAKMLESSNLTDKPDIEFCNELIHNVRNIEIKELNVEN